MPDRLPALDALRGVAILMVIACHIWLAGPGPRYLTYTGVDLFFVLSGYLIGGIVLRHKDDANFAAIFYGRRALRILPLYLLFILIVLGFFPWTPSHLLSYASFTYNFLWAWNGAITPPGWVGPIWSLCVEEQFYLVLPLIVFATPRRALPYVLATLAALAPILRSIVGIGLGEPTIARILLPCRMDALLMGVFVAWWSPGPSERRLLATVAAPLALIAAAMAFFSPEQDSAVMVSGGFTIVSLAYAAVLALIVSSGVARAPARLAAIGRRAYPLYLFHLPIFISIYLMGVPLIGAIFVATCLSFALAIVLHAAIEQPAVNFGRTHLRYQRSAASSSDRRLVLATTT